MISKHSISVFLFGWLIVATYIYYDYTFHQTNVFEHFLSFKTPGNIFFNAIIFCTLIGSHITGYFINDRKKLFLKTIDSEKQLKHAAHEWVTTFDSIPYGVLVTDNKYNIIRANNYVADLSGLTVKELVSNKKCYETVCKQKTRLERCSVMNLDGIRNTETCEYYDRDKSRNYSESITPMVDSKGRTVSYIHVLIDNTESREKENKLSQSKDAFFNMLKDLGFAYKELKDIHNNLIITFSNIIDAKSPWTRGHSINVANYATDIARAMGLNEQEVETLRTAALLHDIGKVGTYDVVLDKPDKLDDIELTLIRQHTIKGEEILSPIKGLNKITPIIRSHHERVDGKGYPDGLIGDKIHPLAKILCVADSYDAMISDRPYRPSRGKNHAMAELTMCTGTQFDPKVAQTFLKILGRSPVNLRTA